MGAVMNQDKLKAVVSELAKDIKTEADLNDLTSQLIKLTVETALNKELDSRLGYEKHAGFPLIFRTHLKRVIILMEVCHAKEKTVLGRVQT